MLFRQSENSSPIPIFEHKTVNGHPVGKFTLVDANVFMDVVRFQNFPRFDRHEFMRP